MMETIDAVLKDINPWIGLAFSESFLFMLLAIAMYRSLRETKK